MKIICTKVDTKSVKVVGIFFSVNKEKINPEIRAGKTKNNVSEMFIIMHIARVAIAYKIKNLFLHKSVTIADENDNSKTKKKKKKGTKVDSKTNITLIATISPNNAIFSTNFSLF